MKTKRGKHPTTPRPCAINLLCDNLNRPSRFFATLANPLCVLYILPQKSLAKFKARFVGAVYEANHDFAIGSCVLRTLGRPSLKFNLNRNRQNFHVSWGGGSVGHSVGREPLLGVYLFSVRVRGCGDCE